MTTPVSKTGTELRFIDGLGERPHKRPVKMSKYELLKTYLGTCDRRTHWDGIEKSVVVQHLRNSILINQMRGN